MHKVAIYRRYAYQSQASVVFCADHFKTIHHVNKHEIVFHNLKYVVAFSIDAEHQFELYVKVSSLTPNNAGFKVEDCTSHILMQIFTSLEKLKRKMHKTIYCKKAIYCYTDGFYSVSTKVGYIMPNT